MYFKIFIIILAIGAIALSFYNPQKERDLNAPEDDSLYGYGRFGLPLRLFSMGLFILVASLVSSFPALLPQSNKIIGIILFCLGIISLTASLLIRFSKKAENIIWKYITPSKYPRRDRNQLAIYLGIMAFGFFFGFYIFYWG